MIDEHRLNVESDSQRFVGAVGHIGVVERAFLELHGDREVGRQAHIAQVLALHEAMNVPVDRVPLETRVSQRQIHSSGAQFPPFDPEANSAGCDPEADDCTCASHLHLIFAAASRVRRPARFQNVYASFIHDRVAIENRKMPGAKNIMWSSDYPHSETTFPDSHKVIARDFAGVPENEKRIIVCERARKLFRIGE